LTPDAFVAQVEAAPKAGRTELVLGPEALAFAASLDELTRTRLKQRLKAAGVVVSDWGRSVEAIIRARSAARQQSSEDGDWQETLTRGAHGKPDATPKNLGTVLRNWERTTTLRLNQLTLEAELDGAALTDGGYFNLREEVEGAFGLVASSELMSDAVGAVAEGRVYHPIRDYLDGLRWDGVRRLHKVPTTILLAPPEPLYGRMVEAWFVAAVARVYDPGRKVDTCLTLFSEKGGQFKTTFFEVVAQDRWITAGHVDPSDKDSVLVAHQSWIKLLDEVDELTRRSEWSALKRWMTERWDTFRAPYGRRPARYMRGFVFGGTTNKQEFLPNDSAAARRFWTIPVGDVQRANIDLLRERMPLLFAEARDLYFAGTGHRTREPSEHLWWLTNDETDKALALAGAHQTDPAWADKIETWLASPLRGAQTAFTTTEVLEGAMKVTDPDKHTRVAKEQVGEAMRHLRYIMTNVTSDGITHGPQRKAWVKR
jgi:putative DNA primase/helicase